MAPQVSQGMGKEYNPYNLNIYRIRGSSGSGNEEFFLPRYNTVMPNGIHGIVSQKIELLLILDFSLIRTIQIQIISKCIITSCNIRHK
jgi:hypothetical protein